MTSCVASRIHKLRVIACVSVQHKRSMPLEHEALSLRTNTPLQLHVTTNFTNLCASCFCNCFRASLSLWISSFFERSTRLELQNRKQLCVLSSTFIFAWNSTHQQFTNNGILVLTGESFPCGINRGNILPD